MRHRLLLAPLAIALLVGACAGGDDAAEQSATEAPAVSRESADVGGFDGDSYENSTVDTSITTRDVITEVTLSLEAPSIGRSVPLIEAAVRAEAGVITFSESGAHAPEEAPDGEGWATIVARIPPDNVDAFIDRLGRSDAIGEITGMSRRSQDVTEQLVELDVRIENQRESVTAIRRLMAEATDLTDLVLLEGEVTRRQTELEILLARQADLEGRVEMATVTIDVYSPGETPDTDRGVIDGFVDGWQALVGVAAALAWFAAVSSPFVAAVAVIAGMVVVVARRRSR